LKRLSIIPADLGKFPIAALKYLLLHVNTLQNDVEFQFLPARNTQGLLADLGPKSTVSLEVLQAQLPTFIATLTADQEELASHFGLPPVDLGRCVIVSSATLDKHYYHLWQPEYSALFLGDWERAMSPPSLLEFLLSLIMVEGLYAVTPSPAAYSHFETRGCIGDFTLSLADARYKILSGHLCTDCLRTAIEAIGEQRANVWRDLLSKSWIGTLGQPLAPAAIVEKLGYNLFVTRGIAPTRWERVKELITQEGPKELIKLCAAVTLAGLLVWLGLKK
jgi:hypothetical protein